MRHLIAALLLIAAATSASAQQSAWYEVESLNEALGPPPQSIDRTTPRGTMESFFDAARRGDWSSAAHLLDLTLLSPDEVANAPAYARDLYMVIDRKVVVDWRGLLDRPDALDARATSESAVAGMPRRSILLWTLDVDGQPIAIRLNRVQPEGEEAVWVFARQSVANIPLLAERFQPSALERMLPDTLREKTIFNLYRWELILFPLVIGLSLLMGFVIHRALSWLSHRTESTLSGKIIKAIRSPVILASLTTVIAIFTEYLFVFSGRIETVLSPLLALGFVSAVLTLIVNIVDAILDRLVPMNSASLSEFDEAYDDRRRIATMVAAGRRVALVVVAIVGFGIVLAAADLFRTFGFSLLASAGVLTLVLGYAARNMLSNIMSSVQIALNQSARIGDKILFRDHLCTVERINFTFVQLRIWTGERLIVPVSEFVSEPFENWALKDPAMIRKVTLKLAHGVDLAPLREAYEDVLDSIEGDIGADEDRGVKVVGHDVFGQDVLFKVPCANANTAWDLECEVREKMIIAASKLEKTSKQKIFPEASAAEAA